jgi:hypothetical protein
MESVARVTRDQRQVGYEFRKPRRRSSGPHLLYDPVRTAARGEWPEKVAG